MENWKEGALFSPAVSCGEYVVGGSERVFRGILLEEEEESAPPDVYYMAKPSQA
ncbi:MAG: hypothetical protein LBJ70_03640 [Holosporales bacterium]|jgi:hypothetical protein|nr:hypothetical protein [Holosporales bacterium]